MSLIESVSEKAVIEDMQVIAKMVLPLNQVPGIVFLTETRLYF